MSIEKKRHVLFLKINRHAYNPTKDNYLLSLNNAKVNGVGSIFEAIIDDRCIIKLILVVMQ